MRTSVVAMAAAFAFVLGGCAVVPPGERAVMTRSAPVFRYAIDGPASVGVVHAFDRDGRTYVQFLDIARANPLIRDADGHAIGFAVSGQYAELARVVDAFEVQTPYGRVRVRARTVPQAGKAENAREFSSAIVGVSSDTLAEAGKTAGRLSGGEWRRDARLGVVTLSFDHGSAELHIAPEVAAALIPAALASSRVEVRGFTDAELADGPNLRMARARVEAARRYLVGQGVAARKIEVVAVPSGSHVAGSWTAEGRARNRRVEIRVIGPGPADVEPAASSDNPLLSEEGAGRLWGPQAVCKIPGAEQRALRLVASAESQHEARSTDARDQGRLEARDRVGQCG